MAEQAPLLALARFTLLQLPLGKFAQALRLRRGLPYRSGCWVVRALGADKLEAVVLSDGRREWQQPCEALGLGFGLLPNTELAQMLGCRLDADGAIAVDAGQQSSVAGIYAAGECTGIAGVDKALIEGRRAALQMLGRSDRSLDRAHGQALRFAPPAEPALRPAARAVPAGRGQDHDLPLRGRLLRRAEDPAQRPRCQAADPLRHGCLPGPHLRPDHRGPVRLVGPQPARAPTAGPGGLLCSAAEPQRSAMMRPKIGFCNGIHSCTEHGNIQYNTLGKVGTNIYFSG